MVDGRELEMLDKAGMLGVVLVGEEVFVVRDVSILSLANLMQIISKEYGVKPASQVVGRIIEMGIEGVHLEVKFSSSWAKMFVPNERIHWVE